MTDRPSTAGNVAHSPPGGTPGPRRQANDNTSMASYSWPPSTVLKFPSLSTSAGSGHRSSSSVLSKPCQPEPAAGHASSQPARAGAVEHHFDLELRQLDSTSDLAGGRNEHCLVQHDEAV